MTFNFGSVMELQENDSDLSGGSKERESELIAETGTESAVEIDEGIDCTDSDGNDLRSRDELIVDRILAEHWRYAQTYSIGKCDTVTFYLLQYSHQHEAKNS